MRLALAISALSVALVACDGEPAADDSAVGDAGGDASLTPPGPDLPWLDAAVPPIVFTPCPDGWREVARGGVTTCDPYPEGGASECAVGEAHFTGEAGCRPIGTPCPAGDYAADLPTDGPLVYVNASAATGGDGSDTAPYARLGDVPWPSLAPGTTVALAKGRYEGTIPAKAGIRVRGACVAETILTGVDAPVAAVVVVTTSGEPVIVENLSIVDAPQIGAKVEAGRGLILNGVLIDGVRTTATLAGGTGATFRATDLVVRNTQVEPASGIGRGLDVESGARFEGERMILEDNFQAGLYLINAEAEARIAQTVIRGTLPTSGAHGNAIEMLYGPSLEAVGVLITENRGLGVLAAGAPTSATLDHTIIRETQTRRLDPDSGRALNFQGGARLEATRLLAEANHGMALFVEGEGASATLTDVVLREAVADEETRGQAFGVNVLNGASLGITRGLVQEPVGSALLISTGSSATLEDVAIRDVQPNVLDGESGRGLGVQIDSIVTGDRVLFSGVHEVGVISLDGSEVTLTNTAFRDVRPSRSADPERTYGYAVTAVSASLTLTDFSVSDAATCGLFIDSLLSEPAPTVLEVQSGIVERSEIGACIQIDGYDLSRLMRDVIYRDNGINLDVTMLPVPSAPTE